MGAYYTPIPLVNYMLNELESRRPLEEGMQVLDASCGSGAFLVQCYRSLIEKKSRAGHPRPAELRNLLTKHIFGVDRDGDACQVAEMSLILTLLDYTTPPDLENSPQFKLPVLRGHNIFKADFFDPDSVWAEKRRHLTADWLVGNPPWRDAKEGTPEDRHVVAWMKQNAGQFPTGGNQVAEAYVWHSLPLMNEGSVAALVLPAMTLFKKESTQFRARLFQSIRPWCVANFSNLAYILFSGRSETPALSIFFSPRPEDEQIDFDERILTFAPMVANQRASRPGRASRKKDAWHLAVNGAEIKEIATASVIRGDFHEWKLAMWGSFRDGKLLNRVAKRFPTMAEFARKNGLSVHQGIELREHGKGDETQPISEIAGRTQVDFSKLRNCGRIFAFPSESLSTIPNEWAHVRKGRAKLPLVVSTPPHIIVDESRRFAVYSDDFIAVPPGQIGISGPAASTKLLRAMSIYLSSDFCVYQQFFMTPQWGVRASIATLYSLKSLPVPIGELSSAKIREWEALWYSLSAEPSGSAAPTDSSLREINSRVNQLLGLNRTERILVEDFVRWNMLMIKGKVSAEVISPPTDRAIHSYLGTLKGELDDFIGRDSGLAHNLHAVRTSDSVMIAIALVRVGIQAPILEDAGESGATILAETRKHLMRSHSQWLYFERSLKIYEHGTMYIFKPLEMIHWTRRQAILDAGDIIAETLGGQRE